MKTGAIFSADGLFRYTLERAWDESKLLLLVVMLNPSTADAERNDATITRVINRAKREGFGGIIVCNLYAYRSPYPAKLMERYASGNEVVGRENDAVIERSVERCDAVLVAWGSHKLAARRDCAVLELLSPLADNIVMLETTKDGFPKHPLHVAYRVPFQRYNGRFA
jgi:hypothetical protein